jgi:hypothetical protein
MAMEPISLFGHELNRTAVAKRMRELAGSVALDVPRDDGWFELTATFGPFWSRKKLVLHYDPTYCSGPNWKQQMEGMRGYFSRFPDTPRKARVMTLTRTFAFTLGTVFHPHAADRTDPRWQAVLELAQLLDAVLFTPSALLDARGRVLFGAGGAVMENPAAEWPRATEAADAGVSADAEDLEEGEDDYEPDPPAAERVAIRALALAALAMRGVLENAPKKEAAETHGRLVSWAREVGAEAEMEEYEREVLLTPPGSLHPQTQTNAMWRLEGLVVLLWALGRADLPPHDHETDPRAVFPAAGMLDADAARALLAAPVLRPRDEIAALRKRLLGLHWRMRDFTIRPQAMDFAHFAATAWFGPMDITSLPLVDGDLAIAGKRIDRAKPPEFGKAQSIAMERHLAVNWLWEGPELYSDADVST